MNETTLTAAQARELMDRFYSIFRPETQIADTLKAVVGEGWTNGSSNGASTTALEYGGIIGALRGAVPDLKWEIQEVLVSGNRVVVRGEGSGTPAAPLFGVLTPTGKSFRILSIDIHTVEGGRITSTIHLEDWLGAMGQLQAP